MKIEVLYFRGCPNHSCAAERVRAVLQQEGVSGDVSEIEVQDESAAKALAFPGSPTIRVNGVDIELAARGAAEVGFACRLYPGGLPSEEMINAALREARGQ
jgi:hypothetical protein